MTVFFYSGIHINTTIEEGEIICHSNINNAREASHKHPNGSLVNLTETCVLIYIEHLLWILLRNSKLLDLTEHNDSHSIPSYCHLLGSCRSLVDHVAPLEAVSRRCNFLTFVEVG
jgi:hypothetical protein